MDDRKSLSITFLAILDQYATLIFSQNGCRRPFWMTENHFRSHFSPFQINTQLLFVLFTKWLQAAILDDRESLLITFLTISDQYATFFFKFTKWLPAAILDDRKLLSNAFLAISDECTTFFCLIFFFKMAAGGHFGSPICAKNNRVLPLCVINGYANFFEHFYTKWPPEAILFFPIDATNHGVLVIWDLNGYGEYEFDRCICDKVMACTSVGVRRRRRRNQKHITEIFKFRGYNYYVRNGPHTVCK